jgi:hypothetical protein
VQNWLFFKEPAVTRRFKSDSCPPAQESSKAKMHHHERKGQSSMNDDDSMQRLPERMSEEADREQITGLGRLLRLHKWWARRPGVIARVATYLAVTEKQSPEDEFLA